MSEFTNPKRTRSYGLRPGDTVKTLFDIGNQRTCIVERLSPIDNNKVYLKDIGTGEVFDWIAEWCEIIDKVEDKTLILQ